MASPSKIRYFPTIEIAIFSLAVASLIFILLILELNLWLLIPGTIFSYGAAMRDACIIKIDNDLIKITSLNIFIASHITSKNSIIIINSMQTLQDDTYEVYGAPYPSSKRRYELEYWSPEGKKRRHIFQSQIRVRKS